MCGLVGAAGNITGDVDKAFKILLILDVLRGEHSTGIAAVHADNTVKVVKQVGPPHELFQDKRFDSAIMAKNRVLIGHNRYATQGAVNRTNAHPFEFDGVVGAHNGTLFNHHNLLGNGLFPVDSQKLYHHMNEEGLEDLMTVLEGAWALTWWDKYEQRMNFLRNKERTLFWIMTEDEKTVFWASEAWMLTVALNKAGIKVKGNPEMFPEDLHVSFEVNGKGEILDLQKAEMPSLADKRRKELYQNKPQGGTVIPFTPTNGQGLKQETIDNKYLSSKNVKLEVLNMVSDRHGQKCFTLFDPKNMEKRIVLYPRRDVNTQGWIGKTIMADITGAMHEPNGTVKYKANPWTVKIVERPTIQEEEEKEEAQVELFRDHHGNQLTKETWMKKYPYCAWCFDPISPSNSPLNYEFSRTNDCICSACVTNPEVKEVM